MATDLSSLGFTPAKTGEVDLSSVGFIPAVGYGPEEGEETTAAGAAGRGAAGMVPLGEQAYSAVAGLTEGKPYVQERKELEEEVKKDIAIHPVARMAGQAAGLAAPALVTGGASVPESLLGAAGQGAAIGAGFGAGKAIDTLTEGGGGSKAATDLAIGTALGAAGGAAGQKIAGLVGKLSPALERYAAGKAMQASGMGAKELGNMTQE